MLGAVAASALWPLIATVPDQAGREAVASFDWDLFSIALAGCVLTGLAGAVLNGLMFDEQLRRLSAGGEQGTER